MSTAKDIVDTMLNKCKLKRLNKKYVRITIRKFTCLIEWPEDPLVDIAHVVNCLLFYHRDVLMYPHGCHCRQTETEKSLRTAGFELVEKYLDEYHSDFHDKPVIYEDYYMTM